MTAPTIEDWKQWRGDFSRLPLVSAFPGAPFPKKWLSWWEEAPFSALLETGKAGRYTVLAPRIDRLLVCGEAASTLLRLDGAEPVEEQTFAGAPLDVLRLWKRNHRAPRLNHAPPFAGGLIGFFSYDFARLLEKLPTAARRDLDVPLAAFALVDKAFVYDHTEETLYCSVHRSIEATTSDATLARAFAEATAETARMKADWDAKASVAGARFPFRESQPEATAAPTRFSFSREEFIAAVQRIQECIRAGETYQTNLSVRETRPLRAAPEEIYEQLRRINPSPYMALLRLPGFSLVSGSPELLIRLRDGKLEARPIAGTRPRGADAAEDEELNRDLIGNSKEKAEHLMLVDLIRNDLGRVSTFGSVAVTEFMTVEVYSHVMHIVSHIEGQLAAGADLFDAIAAAFPGGTITGAPKVRTMEIIDELEPVRRGPYTGSIGWIGFSGDFELNITIRTLLAMNGETHVQAGAGIVIDSDPEREYQESLNKGRALWAAVEAAETEVARRSPTVNRIVPSDVSPQVARMKIYCQGQILPERDARVSAGDHGFLFGASLFETFRTYAGQPFLLTEHLARLAAGCRAYGLETRSLLLANPPALQDLLRELLAVNDLTDAVFRYTVSAGSSPGGLPTGFYQNPTEFIFVRRLPATSPDEGIRIHILNTNRTEPEVFPRPKSGHYINNLIAHRELRQRTSEPTDEGVLFTADGRLSEGVVSNVFLVSNETLLTPDPSSHILEGITRGAVLDIARDAGIDAREKDLHLGDLTSAAAIFTTNSVRGITPVFQVLDRDGKIVWEGNSASDRLVAQLRSAYARLHP